MKALRELKPAVDQQVCSQSHATSRTIAASNQTSVCEYAGGNDGQSGTRPADFDLFGDTVRGPHCTVGVYFGASSFLSSALTQHAVACASPKAATKRKPAGKTAAQVAEDRARFAANVEAQKAAIDAETDEMMKALEAGVDENFGCWDPVRAPWSLI